MATFKLTKAQEKALKVNCDEGEGFLAIRSNGGVQFVRFYVSFRGEVLETDTELPVHLKFAEAVSIDEPSREREVRLIAEG